MRNGKKYFAILAAIALLSGILPADVSMAAKKVALSYKKLTVTVGKTKTLKLKNNKKNVKWTVTSGKKNVTLKSKKRTSVKIVGKKKGTAKVQAKVGKKKYVCTVTVKAKTSTKKATAKPTNAPIPTATATPTPPKANSWAAGLYDEDMKLLYSWDELVKKNWINGTSNEIRHSNSIKLQGKLVISTSVTKIKKDAFERCTGLTSIEIPSSVTSIEEAAFRGCSGVLTIVVAGKNPVYDSRNNCNGIIEKKTNQLVVGCKSTIIPTNVSAIGNYAFVGCSTLTGIEIPTSVTSIGEAAFRYCTSLTDIEIPASVTSIGKNAFSRCSGLMSIVVDDRNPVYDSRKDCNALIETETNKLIVGCQNTIIPTGVTSIGEEAFCECNKLTSIEIPTGVTSIEDYAFTDCSSLVSIKISSSVTSIGQVAFWGCRKLTSVEIPTGVQSIEYGTFAECGSLTSVIIPASVTSIGEVAFFGCSKLASIEIPSSVVGIDFGAFCRCDSLTSIEIPDSVTSIGSNTFSYCPNLAKIVIDSENTVYDSRNDCNAIIETETNKLIVGCKNTIIPTTVTSIGEYAFYHCRNLISIEIPVGVTSIEGGAFECCTNLTSIEIPASVTSIGTYAFRDCRRVTNIVVDSENAVYDSRNDCNAIIETETNRLICGCGNTVIPSDVTIIWGYAFFNCSSLTSIEIPASVEYVGCYAFSGCSSLTKIYCHAESKPDGWDVNWREECNATIVWGYTGD